MRVHLEHVFPGGRWRAVRGTCPSPGFKLFRCRFAAPMVLSAALAQPAIWQEVLKNAAHAFITIRSLPSCPTCPACPAAPTITLSCPACPGLSCPEQLPSVSFGVWLLALLVGLLVGFGAGCACGSCCRPRAHAAPAAEAAAPAARGGGKGGGIWRNGA